jgi:hypothetical protein
MSDTHTMDFFAQLEHQLHTAAEHSPPAWRTWVPTRRAVLACAGVAAALALALVPAIAVLGGHDRDGGTGERSLPSGPPPVGTVIHRGRVSYTVVATGSAPVAGTWVMETYTSSRLADPETGEEYQPAGLRCLSLRRPDAGSASGQCGEFPKTPGFGRQQTSVPESGAPGRVKEVLVFGRVPERATAVVLTVHGKVRERVQPLEGPGQPRGNFYLLAIAPNLVNGRVNWLYADGREGSRGMALLPL